MLSLAQQLEPGLPVNNSNYYFYRAQSAHQNISVILVTVLTSNMYFRIIYTFGKIPYLLASPKGHCLMGSSQQQKTITKIYNLHTESSKKFNLCDTGRGVVE